MYKPCLPLTLMELLMRGRSMKKATSAGMWNSRPSVSRPGIRLLYSSGLKWVERNPPNWTSVSRHYMCVCVCVCVCSKSVKYWC